MKPRELFYLLGLRPRARTYGCQVVAFDLPHDGHIEYAQWLHPRETAKRISQESIDELRRFLRPGDVAIDIGAHTGDSSLPIALAVGKSGCVLALEPNPHVFPVLQRNAALNVAQATIIPLPFAATAEDGEYEFQYGDSGFCNGGLHENVSRWKHGLAFKLKVQGKNLTKYLEHEYAELIPRVRYIKIDAEGYDLQVLLSLSSLIARQHPFIRAEVYKWAQRAEREQISEFLAERGYTVRRLQNEEHYCGELVTSRRLMEWKQYDIFAIPSGATESVSQRRI